MAGIGPTDLDALAHDLLDAAIDALDTIPNFSPGLAGAPERTFVSPGQPALDCCDQLTVHVGPIVEDPLSPSGPSSGQRARFAARKNQVALVLTLTRCHDLSKIPPDTATLDAAAEQGNADAWALWNDLWNQVRSGDFLTLCADSRPELRPLQPAGGCTGWTLTYRVWQEGYEAP
jgi:hypothetical protein